MKQQIIILIIMAVLLSTTVSAAIKITTHELPIGEVGLFGGCEPPISYAEEHGCTLTKKSGLVNGYLCGGKIIYSRCDGTVYDVQEFQGPTLKTTLISGLIVILVLVIIISIIWLYDKYLNEKMDDDEEYY